MILALLRRRKPSWRGCYLHWQTVRWLNNSENLLILTLFALAEPGTTLGLVQERTLDAILHCLGNVHARSGCPELEAALCKALRSIVSTCCLVFGTNEWGLQKDYTDQEREDAHHAVSRLFRVRYRSRPGKVSLIY